MPLTGLLPTIAMALAATQFLAGESYGALDHAPAVDDADDTGHGDASDTDRAGIVEEDVLRRHVADRSGDRWIPHGQHLVVEEQRHAGNDEPPYGQ